MFIFDSSVGITNQNSMKSLAEMQGFLFDGDSANYNVLFYLE
jgi:hypothetical protein